MPCQGQNNTSKALPHTRRLGEVSVTIKGVKDAGVTIPTSFPFTSQVSHHKRVLLETQAREDSSCSYSSNGVSLPKYLKQPLTLGLQLLTWDLAPEYLFKHLLFHIMHQYLSDSVISFMFLLPTPLCSIFVHVCVPVSSL